MFLLGRRDDAESGSERAAELNKFSINNWRKGAGVEVADFEIFLCKVKNQSECS